MDTEEKFVKCLNCGNEYTGNFCPNCGQKAKTKRLKLREILADFANSIIGGDNKFANTLRGMCCRPGHMVREYLQGHRCQYYNPLQMLIWIVSIYAVFSFLLGKDPFGFTGVPEDKVVPVEGTPWNVFIAIAKNVSNFVSYNKLYNSLFLGLVLILPNWVAFRKYKIFRPDGARLPLNCTEQFYTILYESCMEMMFATLILPFSFIKGAEEILKDINNYVDILFTIIVYKQLYGIGWWKSIKRSLEAGILFIILSVLVIVISAVVATLIFALIYGTDSLNTK